MKGKVAIGVILSVMFGLTQVGVSSQVLAKPTGKSMRVISESTVTGFPFPESVGYDPRSKTLFVSQFVSALKPTEKDGQGRISKVSVRGKVLEEQFLPAPGGEALHKPKGIWIQNGLLWVTDIDAVWIFELKTRKGRKLDLPGIQFANDPVVRGRVLYVSDNRGDQLYRVTPANFLNAKKKPKVQVFLTGRSINPNGLARGGKGVLLMAGFKSAEEPRGIYSLKGRTLKNLTGPIGRLDGIYQMRDGSLLATDWNSGALFQWSAAGGRKDLAIGFKGPADFCVVPEPGGTLVVVPDLVKSELRFVHLRR